MSYYPDLSYYEYTDCRWLYKDGRSPLLLNGGWLEPGHEFSTKEYSDAAKKGLKWLLHAHCLYPVNETCGHQVCPFCPDRKWQDQHSEECMFRGNLSKVALGNGEIFVTGPNNLIFVAPTLVYHYILEHNYMPPDIFLKALGREHRDLDDYAYYKKMQDFDLWGEIEV